MLSKDSLSGGLCCNRDKYMQNLLSWLALKSIAGVGNHLYKQLIDRFNTPEAVFAATRKELLTVRGISPRIAENIRRHRVCMSSGEEMRLVQTHGCRVVTLNDPEYPESLRYIHDPPPFFYIKGGLKDYKHGIAIVGSRNASRYGMSMARRLGHDLANAGFVIVSGMARGVDTAAHIGAMDAGGETAAVLGNGLAIVYPPENKYLFQQVRENGALISEFPMMEGPNAYNFPARNRIISGMTLGTVVVEASQKSGSLITARLAAEQGRDVFAVPGSAHSPKSVGAHNLIKQGAKLVTSAQDVMEEYPHLLNQAEVGGGTRNGSRDNVCEMDSMAPLNAFEQRLYRLLDSYPVHIDELCRLSDLDAGKVAGVLLSLELKGMINQMPGKYFCKKEVECE